MKPTLPLFALTLAAVPAHADETRELDAHVHGVGELNIAVEGTTVAMELHAPGADIVGFEYAAESDEDKATVAAALTSLSAPLDLIVLPDAAGCTVTEAAAELEIEGEEGHDDHGHEGHDHDDEHAEDEHGHDDHDHDKEEHAHDDHGHDEHGHDEAAEGGHSEFHAEYTLTCADPSAIDAITFAYFETFPNALELEVQIVTEGGAQAFEVERDAPVLNLDGLL